MKRLVVIALAIATFSCRGESELPKLFPVPPTTLVSESGKPVNLKEMNGFVTVYDFIFTSCGGTCPVMTQNMRKLTREIDAEAPVRFVSISVDPTRDTPPVLAEYANRHRNDKRWIFLTGDRDAILKLSVEGFKLAAGGEPMPGNEPLLHSSKFVVVDKQGMIRDYPSGIDSAVLNDIAANVRRLAAE